MSVGDVVFIPDLAQYGTINRITGNHITHVEIKTVNGPEVIEVITLVIEAVNIATSLFQLIKIIIKSIKSLFK